MMLLLLVVVLVVFDYSSIAVNGFSPVVTTQGGRICRLKKYDLIQRKGYVEHDDKWYQDFDSPEYDKSKNNRSDIKDDEEFDDTPVGGRTLYYDESRHDYDRIQNIDAGADDLNFDIDSVNTLIEERHQCRIRKEWEDADMIRTQLLEEHGVKIDDKDRTWISGQISPPKNAFADNYEYERDVIWDNSEDVNVDVVNALIRERNQFRKAGNFEEADAMRSALLEEHGVIVQDKTRTWRSGCSSSRNNQRPNRTTSTPKDFGPNGHDYRLAEDAGPSITSLSEDEIHAMIAERLQCKLNRDYDAADAVHEQLFQNDVLIQDRRKLWRADGQTFAGFGATKYGQSKHSSPTAELPIAEIETKIAERAKYKSERVYHRADEIRDELVEQFNVYIDDKLKQWSVGGNFGHSQQDGGSHVYKRTFCMAPGSAIIPEHADKIQELVETRDAARADREFKKADDIKQDLWDRYNIYVDDKLRQWSLGRSFEPKNDNKEGEDAQQQPSPPQPTTTLYNRRGSLGHLTVEDEVEIHRLVRERNDAKRKRSYDDADRIRDLIKDDYQVYIDDRNREWYLISTEYAPSVQSGPIEDAAVLAYVETQIWKRAQARKNRNYSMADEIRVELSQQYEVTIDDRLKEWTKLRKGEQEERRSY